MTFDIKVDGQLQFDAFLHCLLQGGDLLSCKLVPGGNKTSKARFNWISFYIVPVIFHTSHYTVCQSHLYTRSLLSSISFRFSAVYLLRYFPGLYLSVRYLILGTSNLHAVLGQNSVYLTQHNQTVIEKVLFEHVCKWVNLGFV